ncbi:uncharacterized protein LOC132250990 [Alligator mississippiensis]|uniref:uncharacterized protein LOC132250990 n=1 Tax=Alligator mississippiensis TaxID=8496 RepID=UPI002877D84B|nr:uncharacterized protein LOC132250990 [Alligator mississippiensis]
MVFGLGAPGRLTGAFCLTAAGLPAAPAAAALAPRSITGDPASSSFSPTTGAAAGFSTGSADSLSAGLSTRTAASCSAPFLGAASGSASFAPALRGWRLTPRLLGLLSPASSVQPPRCFGGAAFCFSRPACPATAAQPQPDKRPTDDLRRRGLPSAPPALREVPAPAELGLALGTLGCDMLMKTTAHPSNPPRGSEDQRYSFAGSNEGPFATQKDLRSLAAPCGAETHGAAHGLCGVAPAPAHG